MPTGFDLLEQSGDFRWHWIRRIAAGVIDAAIIAAPISLALINSDSEWGVILAGIFSGLGLFAYSTILESAFGQTIGKRVLHLRVVSTIQRRGFHQILIRNAPKIFWYAFLPFDILAGLTIKGDPRQRWIDHLTNTTVVHYSPSRIRPSPMILREYAEQDITEGEKTIKSL